LIEISISAAISSTQKQLYMLSHWLCVNKKCALKAIYMLCSSITAHLASNLSLHQLTW